MCLAYDSGKLQSTLAASGRDHVLLCVVHIKKEREREALLYKDQFLSLGIQSLESKNSTTSTGFSATQRAKHHFLFRPYQIIPVISTPSDHHNNNQIYASEKSKSIFKQEHYHFKCYLVNWQVTKLLHADQCIIKNKVLLYKNIF